MFSLESIMETVTVTLKELLLRIKDAFVNYELFSDSLDIVLVTFLFYALIKQLRKSQAIQVLKGIILVVFIYGIVILFNMNTSSFILGKLFGDIIVILVVLFSGELRQALERMGKSKFSSHFSFFGSSKDDEVDAINAVCRAAGAMSRSKVGSLILFQRNSLLGSLTKQSVSIDSETSFEMLCSIFWPKAPLHDGAVIIHNGRIVAARCVVPMKNDRVVEDAVGTRHRAAMEATADSDCIAVVTSEETGIISYALEGKLYRGISNSELRRVLSRELLDDADDKKTPRNFFRGKGKKLPPEAKPESETDELINKLQQEGQVNTDENSESEK